MEIKDDLVNKLATLSRLQFNEEEKATIRHDLEKMFSFVDKLNELDTSGVEPLMHISSNRDVLRDDDVIQDFSRDEALKNAPVTDSRYFKVPRVISK